MQIKQLIIFYLYFYLFLKKNDFCFNLRKEKKY